MVEIGTNIETAIYHLRKKDVIGLPTETVYGLAGNALNEQAILKIFEVKNRPFFDPLIIHVADIDSVSDYVTYIPPALKKIMTHFGAGPITYLLQRKAIIPDLVTAGLERVAIRIPKNPLAQQLLSSLDFPLAAPSANPFGYISPTSAQHVAQQLGEKIPYVLDGGVCSVGLESTIIGWDGTSVLVHRLGGLSLEELKEVNENIKLELSISSNPISPGQLDTHYAPRKKMYLGDINILKQEFHHTNYGLLTFGSQKLLSDLHLDLSKNGSIEEAAINLFAYMRQLDDSNCEIILAEALPEVGLGRAINDRLRRASC